MPHTCCDVLCSWVLPQARVAVADYYRPFLTVTPRLEVWCVKLIHLSHCPGGTPAYLVDFELCPWIGQRVTISVCRLRVRITRFDGTVEVEELRQLRSFPIPHELWEVVNQPF